MSKHWMHRLRAPLAGLLTVLTGTAVLAIAKAGS